MKFSEIMNLPWDRYSGRIDMAALEYALPETPRDVLEVFSDHGRKSQFQKQYGHIDLSALRWQCVELPAAEIIECSIYDGHSSFFASVIQRTGSFASEGWRCIRGRPEVVAHWERYRTWVGATEDRHGAP